jgi:hypothetical protein
MNRLYVRSGGGAKSERFEPDGCREVGGAADSPAAMPAAALATARVIELDPEDWLWATWRPRTPWPRPRPDAFDMEDCLHRLGKLKSRREKLDWDWSHRLGKLKSRREKLDWDWSQAELAPVMTRQEAHFWLVAMTAVGKGLKPVEAAARLRAAQKTFDGKLSWTEALWRLKSGPRSLPGELMIPLLTLFSVEQWLDMWEEAMDWSGYQVVDLFHDLLDGFRRHALPYLTEAEHQTIRNVVRPRLGTPSLPRDYSHTFPVAYYLAAILGLHDEVAAIIRSIPDDYYYYFNKPLYCDMCQRPQLLVLGLGDPRWVGSEMRRLGLVLNRPGDIRGWLAHTEFSALDHVRNSILSASGLDDGVAAPSDRCAALLEVLARVKAPEAAPVMLELMLWSRAKKVARRWLDENPGHAIAGLIPATTAQGKPTLGEAALEYLREQKRKGRADFIRACLAAAPPEAAAKVRREVLEPFEIIAPVLDAGSTPDWLRSALDHAQRLQLKPPAWIVAGGLPPICVSGRRLDDKQVATVLAALARSKLGEPHRLVAALKVHADCAALDAFAWAVFERWLEEGAPANEGWAMAAVGLFGSDAAAKKLTSLILTWTDESFQRAIFGLKCLRAIGSDAALMQLQGITERARSWGLKAAEMKTKAAEMMEAIARNRGLSCAELEYRLVPDCGLDDRGGRFFDFGPRMFRFALGPAMKPMVRDEAGRLHRNLPRPTAEDDPARAAAAVAEWKRQKQQVRAVARIQAVRLKRAMLTHRRWKPADFEAFLVRHPLLIHLVRRVLWGGYDKAGKLVVTFRVTGERDYTDVHEAPLRLDRLATVGVVHPMDLTTEQAVAWAEVFADYAIIPPFPQLDRKVHRLKR